MREEELWAEGMRAGFLLAARLAGDGAKAEAFLSLPTALRHELQGESTSGRELAQRVRRRPSRGQLEDRNERASTLLASALPKRERVQYAGTAPRRGYSPPAGLLETLLAFPSAQDRAEACARERAAVNRLLAASRSTDSPDASG